MTFSTGSHRLGPGSGEFLVRTYRDGVAARVGHDLVLEVTGWEATVTVPADGEASIVLRADTGSFAVREGLRGVKPLTDRDRAEIRKNIEKVLGGRAVEFRSTRVRSTDGGLEIDGELAIGDRRGSLSARLDVDPDGRVTGTIPITQTDWGITPYRGLMGALRVRDEVEVAIDVRPGAG